MNEFSGSDQAAATTAPEDTAEDSPEKIRIAGVRLRFGARPIFHLAGEIPLRVGDKVVVETGGEEEEFGEICESPRIFPARYHKKTATEGPSPRGSGRPQKDREVGKAGSGCAGILPQKDQRDEIAHATSSM